MKLFYDLRVDRLVAAPGQDAPITGFAGKAGDSGTLIQLVFGRSSDPTSISSIVTAPTWTPENLPGGTVIKIGIKAEGAYSDGVLLASNSTWTHDAVAYTYTGSLDLNTTEISTALFRDDANDDNDVASLECNFELTYQSGGSGGWRSSIELIPFTIYHDILVGDEATPASAANPAEYLLKASGIEWLPTVTSQTGGTAADLDAVPTVAVTVGKVVMFKDADTSDLMRTYQLTAGSDAESAPTVIRPDDFNASTNAKVWKQRQIDATLSLPATVSQAEAEAGTSTATRTFTPERVKQAIAALESSKGTGTSVANEVVLFNGTDGRQLKRATTTGIAKLTSGVLSAATAGTDYLAAGAITTSGLTMSTARLLGRTTGSTGAVQEISAGAGLSLAGGSIAVAGAYTASGLTMNTARLLGRTTASSGAAEEISIGANLTLSGGTLSATNSPHLPVSVVTLTADTTLIESVHNYDYVECTGSTSQLVISAQSTSSWPDGSHFWIVNRRTSGSITVTFAFGVTIIYAGSSTGSFTIAHTDRPVHMWRSASDVWRVIS
jgi:hypothetical protein